METSKPFIRPAFGIRSSDPRLPSPSVKPFQSATPQAFCRRAQTRTNAFQEPGPNQHVRSPAFGIPGPSCCRQPALAAVPWSCLHSLRNRCGSPAESEGEQGESDPGAGEAPGERPGGCQVQNRAAQAGAARREAAGGGGALSPPAQRSGCLLRPIRWPNGPVRPIGRSNAS